VYGKILRLKKGKSRVRVVLRTILRGGRARWVSKAADRAETGKAETLQTRGGKRVLRGEKKRGR